MNRLTNEQRLQIIEFYYQNECSVKKVHRALLPFYGQFRRPSLSAIRGVVMKFRTKFTLLDIKPSTRSCNVRNEENIAAVAASVQEDRELSIRRRSQQLGLCYSTTPVNWPPRSCDLTSLDYFLWGHVKAHVYSDKPATIGALEANIEAFMSEIPAEMLERVCQNWTKWITR